MKDNNVSTFGPVIHRSNFEAYHGIDLWIVDEADLSIKNFAVAFETNLKSPLSGLFHLLSRPVMMCSAAFSDFETEYIEEVFGIK